MKLQKTGGFASIGALCAYISFGVYGSYFFSSVDSKDPASIMAATLAAPGKIYIYNLLTLIFCILLLTMFVALYERTHKNSPYLSLIMLIAISATTVTWMTGSIINFVSVVTLVPTQDLSAYRAFWTVSSALDTAALHLSGWSVLFLGCGILGSRSFSPILGWLFIVNGILKIPGSILQTTGSSIIPFIRPIALITFITAFTWIAIAMLRKESLPSGIEMAAVE